MDEILYHGAREVPEAALPAGERLRRRWEDVSYRVGRFFSGKRLSPGLFLLSALLIGAVTTFSTVYTQGYAVTVNGRDLGVVADPQEVDNIVERVEARVSDILGEPYTLSAEIAYTPQLIDRSKLSSLSGYETFLFNQVTDIQTTYALSVDGTKLGTFSDKAQLDAILDELKAPYVNENTVSCDFTVPVHIDPEYTTSAVEDNNIGYFRSLLTANSVEKATYTVEAGDSYIAIAKAHGMTLDQLLAMNPDFDVNYLYVGDVLTVRQSVPYLSVQTVDQLTFQEAVPAPVEYVDDDTMYEGDSKVLEEGAEGLALVTARITYINGQEDHRDVLESRELTAPQTRVVAQGTKERPKTMAKGTFIWPCRGVITSPYGYRSIFGSYSYHSGLDIAVPYGTKIKASDGGRVEKAGWNDSYGYLVVIDHENGYRTYYAHNSKLLVKAGERVYQGQVIARAGSTGNSTGSHCHFEVRVNNKAQDPRKYL